MKGYIREIRVLELLLYFLLPLIALAPLTAAVICSAMLLEIYHAVFAIVLCSVLLYFDLKYLLIGSVLMYKAFAPAAVRDKCRFHPSCSTYMIIAVKKYGLFRGFFKGIRRIMRCRPPNGGTDLP